MVKTEYIPISGNEDLIGVRAKILAVEHYSEYLHGAVGTIEGVFNKLYLKFDEKRMSSPWMGMDGIYLTSDAFEVI